MKAGKLKITGLVSMISSSVAALIYYFTQSGGIWIGVYYTLFGIILLAANFLLFWVVWTFNKWILLKVTAIVIIVALNSFASCCVVFYFLEQKITFQPNNSVQCFKALKAESSFREISIAARDGVHLDGWLKINTDKQPAPLVIFFSGSSTNSSKTFEDFSNNGTFEKFAGYNVMMADYRGYGYSAGTGSDTTLNSDAVDVYDYAAKQPFTDKEHIVPIGYSLGTGAATYLAAQRKTAGLVLVAPYYDGYSLFNSIMNIFYGPMKLLIRYKLDSKSYAPQVSAAPLIITSKSDRNISWMQSEKLAGRFKKVYKLVYIKDAKHTQYFKEEAALNEISSYLNVIKEGGAQ